MKEKVYNGVTAYFTIRYYSTSEGEFIKIYRNGHFRKKYKKVKKLYIEIRDKK